MAGLLRTRWLGIVCVSLLTFVLSPAAVKAALLIVDWGGEYVSSTQDLQGKNSFSDSTGIDADGDTNADDSIGGRRFSDSTAMNPTSGYSGTSGTFYGGAITAHQDSIDAAGFDEFAIQNQGMNDSLHVHLSHSGHLHDMHMLMYWKQEDFLNGADSAMPVTFDENSSATIGIGPGPVENLADAHIRLLVRDAGGSFWLSQAAFDSPNSNDSFTWNSGNQGFNSTNDGLWAPFDPTLAFPKLPSGSSAPGSDLRFDAGTASFTAQNFSNITAIGYYFENDVFHNNLDFHITNFSASVAVPVPEPSTMTLLGATALGLLGYRRRKRKLNSGV